MSNKELNTVLHEKVDELVKKYSGNDYVCGRLSNYILTQLPRFLETAHQKKNEKQLRKQHLTSDIDKFVKRFTALENYYYCDNNQLFMRYDGVHFLAHSEDEIQHKILTLLRADENLREKKYKINDMIIKQIKISTPLTCIPESTTVQNVIQILFPAIFPSKNHAKYFLCIIGDCMKKNTNLIYIMSYRWKYIIDEMSHQLYIHFGNSNVFNSIKFKFHDHDYKNTRLIYSNNNATRPIVSQDFYKFIMDILCVASYYSNRYQSADYFLIEHSDTPLTNHALFLRDKTQQDVIDDFTSKCIQKCIDTSISSKNMIFIWKHYLDEGNLPNVIFQDSLCQQLKERIIYNNISDSFENVTSLLLPDVKCFVLFWDSHMFQDTSDYDIEINEVSAIFHKWGGKKSNSTNNNDEMFLLKLIRHFYPDVIIRDNKNILNMRCGIWDKKQEVIESLEMFKQTIEKEDVVTIHEAYQYYVTFSSNKDVTRLNVSKKYFANISRNIIENNIDEKGLINTEWIES